MKDEEKYTAVNDEFLKQVIALVEEHDLVDNLNEETRDKFSTYKEMTDE